MEFVRTELEVKVYGETFKMRYPTYKDTVLYQTKVKEAGDDSGKVVSALMDFLDLLGLPKAKTEELEMQHLNTLVDTILNQKKT